MALPLLLSAPGAPKTEEVVLATGAPDEALAEEPAADDAGGGPVAEAEGEDVAVEAEAATSSTGAPTAQTAAIAARRPAKTRAPVPSRSTATTKKPSTTIKATVARAAAAPTTTAAPPPPPPPPPTSPPPPPVPGGDAVWDKLAYCESGNTNDPGAPYYGYWQFSEPTWLSLGETGLPNEHSRDRQLHAAKRLQAARGWAPWPECSRRLGLA